MVSNFQRIGLKIAKEASHTLPLPSFVCFLLEILSQSQILSLIFTQLLTRDSLQTTSHLSQTLNQLLSYLEPLHILNPFTSESMALTMFCLSIVYISTLLGALFITSLLIQKRNELKIALSKVLSFMYLLHSRVLFFPLHCFAAKALEMNSNCGGFSESLYCNKGWLFGVVLLLVLNIAVAVIKETLCFTIHREHSHYSMKGNHQPLAILFHKIIVVLLYYLIDNGTNAVVLCNIGFCILTLVILQVGFPFYSSQTLKISVICSTICTICALVSFARIPGYEKDLILLTLCLLPVSIKISLILLQRTLWTVFQQKAKRPYQAVHLPVLIEDYQGKMSLFPFPTKMNSKTLFSLAFIRGNVPEGYNLKDEHEYSKITAETYKAAISYLEELSKQYPNDELLIISMMEIYVNILKDTMKAICTINRLRTHPKLSLVGHLSLEMIAGKFEGHQFSIEETTAGKKTIHLDFFMVKVKTAKLKGLIKKEVEGHLILWRQIEGKNVDVMNIIQKVNQISSQGKKVAKYWNENFCNSEGIYVSASIIYGLYIQIVQALPFEGLKLARKAYKAIRNRFHTHKELMDIITGKSAIIAASIEPDKLGKIVDVSSSVKKMFRAGKHGLIGTNLNGILPVAVAARHNGFIRNYLYRNSRDELNTQIVNYARTLDGEYFKVKVSLLISPFTQNGLNVVAHVKRLSENEPIMIIDQEGKIIEYSESLGNFLNINVKREATKIEALYPELERVNHAFNVFYKAEKEEEAEETVQKNKNLLSASISFEDDFQLDAVKLTNSQLHNPAPQSSRRLLSQGTTTDRSIGKFETKPAASSKTGQWKLLAQYLTLAKMGKGEAEEICGKFKDGHEVTYLGGKKLGESIAGLIKNKIEIEPLIIDGLIFKVLKFKHNVPFLIDNNPNNKSTTCGVQKGTTLGLFDEFADRFPIDEERNSPKAQQEASVRISTPLKPRYEAFDTDSVLRSPGLSPQKSHFDLLGMNKASSMNSKFMQSKASMDNSNSEIDSQMSSRIIAKRVNSTLQIERPNKATSLSIRMVYLAVVVIITSICVDLIFTKKSLENMEQAMNLVSTVNLRFSKSLIAWQSVGVLYTRISGFRPFDIVKILKYQGLTTNSSLVMLENAIALAEEIQDFDDDRVTGIFYDRNIALYDPIERNLFNERKSDSFTASTILTTYNLYIGKYSSVNIKDLNGSKEMLFVLNNTANDYMESLENAITDVSAYFQNTRKSNISLLKVIMSLELLFVITPVILIACLIVVILKLYIKLFGAVTNLLPESTFWRISQLEKIQEHLEEDIEDSLIDFEHFKVKEYTKILVPNQNVSVGSRSKEFSMKGLRFYVLRYLLVACCLVTVIIILFSISLSNSIENMEALNKINKKALVSYQTGSDVKMVIPSFYFAAMFANETSYKIKNSNPLSQVKIYMDALGNANNELITNLYSDSEDLEDATVKDILEGDVCNYVEAQFQKDCWNYTNTGAFGLLGLQPKFYQVCGVINTYLRLVNPTVTQASNAVGTFSTTLINLHFVIYDAYDSLSAYFVRQFNKLVTKKISDSYTVFAANMTTMLVAMVLIRIVVLKRLQDLQITVRRIVRIIPYKIIEENKIMSYYLASEFGQELREMREIQG